MKNLELWSEYTREEIHGIFSPDTKFTPQAGTWGLHGIIPVPDREGDWVFIVTYGNKQGEHTFDESITEDGVLSWQSQPRMDFNSEAIKSFINHDDRVNNIYLFLRANDKNPYGYFGRLGYLTHDSERQNPVYFQWQILDWEPPSEFINKVGISLIGSESIESFQPEPVALNQLIYVEKPAPRVKGAGVKTSEFRSRKSPDYGLIDSRNKKLGLEGELFILDQEIRALKEAGKFELAEKVVHVSVVEGDGAGHDVKSFDTEGNPKYIEIKTTKGSASTPFFISPNELEYSKQHPEGYHLYRLCEFDPVAKTGKVIVLRGDLSTQLNITPTQYKADFNIS
jgi:Domain of unknown function (DUF3883)/Domain of unknown function (DUF3427)